MAGPNTKQGEFEFLSQTSGGHGVVGKIVRKLCCVKILYLELTLHGWIKYLDLLTGERCVENIQTWEVFGVRHGRYV